MPALFSARAAGCLVASALLTMAISPALAGADGSTGSETAFAGHAYGASVSLGTLVTQSATADLSLCTKNPDTSASATVGTALRLPGLAGSLGAASTSVESKTLSGGKVESISTTTVQSTSLAGGAVSFTSLQLSASVTRQGTTYKNASSLTFTGLQVTGYPDLSQTPPPNTSLPLDGLGTLVLNQHTTSARGGAHSNLITALVLKVDADNPIAAAGGSILVGHADALLHDPVHHMASGSSYGTSIGLGSTLTEGRTAAASLPCGGSGGITGTVPGKAVTVAGALSAGPGTSTYDSTDSPSVTTALTTSSTPAVSLFNGVVTASSVTARAHTSRTASNKLTSASTGTEVVDLVVKGKSYGTVTRPRTVTIANLGSLLLNQVVPSKGSNGTKVYAMQLVLSVNHAGMKKGTTITVGYAQSAVAA
jgi:hypothetical protein